MLSAAARCNVFFLLSCSSLNVVVSPCHTQITRKLAGGAAGTAARVTNVGKEYGQVLMSVLTAAEGDGLVDMGL